MKIWGFYGVYISHINNIFNTLTTQAYEKKLFLCIYLMHNPEFIRSGNGCGMAKRHQILHPGFLKPGHHYTGSAVSDHRELDSERQITTIRQAEQRLRFQIDQTQPAGRAGL